jgi:Ca-activated chloride channel family protein
MNRAVLFTGFLAAGLLLVGRSTLTGQPPQPPGKGVMPQSKQPGPAPAVPEPVSFTTKEGKKGWKIAIPGQRPLATPAVSDGKVFLGGGFGSHEFYAFDAQTGKKIWLYRTGDDGPTAAVIDQGYVAFNTESCELEIITMDGKRVWKKWLGDPLMSMPAMADGKVYMAYPDSKGDHRHHLACFDVKTGKEQWKKPIAGDIITAPVLANQQVYLASLEGTMYCFSQSDGRLVWSEKKNATSSPLVYDGKLYYSRRDALALKDAKGKTYQQQTEQIARRPVAAGGASINLPATSRPADYLDAGKRAAMSKAEKNNAIQDGAVGFAMAPAAAGLGGAGANLGQMRVSGVWGFQGSRPFLYKDKLYSSMGDEVKCVDPKTDKVLWKKQLHPAKKDKGPLVDATLTPPALVNDKVFVGTSHGEIVCLSAESGDELLRATVGAPILFQPAVAGGRVYAGSGAGTLYCVETGDERDDGWRMWGGDAAHNGLVK